MRSWTIAAALGIAVMSWLPSIPSAEPIIGLLLLLFVYLSFPFKKSPWALKLNISLAALLLGLLYGICFAQQLLHSLLPSSLDAKPVELTLRVEGLPEYRDIYGQQSTLFTARVLSNSQNLSLKKIRLRWLGAPKIEPGQHWLLVAKLRRPRGLANPASFDYQHWLIAKGIHATGWVDNSQAFKRLEPGILNKFRLRYAASKHLDSILVGVAEPAIIKALLIADKRRVDKDDWQLFADSGVIHLMVISGLHIGIVASYAYLLGRGLAVLLPCSSLLAGSVFALSIAFVYSLLAGFSLPTQRALIMMAVFFLFRASGRYIPVSTAFAVAVLCCLLFDPLATTQPSFWLSFIAVAIIIMFVSGCRNDAPLIKRLLYLQLALYLGMAPILLLYFQQLPSVVTLINLLAVPLFSVLLIPILIIAFTLSIFDNLLISKYLFIFSGQLLKYFITVLECLSDKADAIAISAMTTGTTMLVAILVISLLLPRGLPLKLPSFILLLFILWQKPKPLADQEFIVTVLDVGQGLSVVVQTRSTNWVFDTGASWQNGSMAQQVLIPYLRSQGVKRLEGVIISHGDNDHAGGLADLSKAFTIGNLYGQQSVFMTAAAMQAKSCESQTWQLDGIRFDLFNAGGDERERSSNDGSCLLRVSNSKHQVLLTGDIERQAEAKLWQSVPELLPASVLLAPHHGSLSSSSWPFIRTVNPQYVVFSQGYKNRFHHPHPRVVDRYQSLQVKAFSTALQGAISIKSLYDQPLEVTYQRQYKSFYWQ